MIGYARDEITRKREKRHMQGDRKMLEAFYSCSTCNAEKDAVFVVDIEPVKEALTKRLKEHAHSVDWSRVVGFIDVSRHSNSSAGILVCETKAYFFGFPKKPVKVWYDEINGIVARKSKEEFVGIKLRFRDGSDFTWESNALDCRSLAVMFNKLRCARIEICDAYMDANLKSANRPALLTKREDSQLEAEGLLTRYSTKSGFTQGRGTVSLLSGRTTLKIVSMVRRRV